MRFHRYTPSGCSDAADNSNATLLNRHNTLMRLLFGYNSVSSPFLHEGVFVRLCEEVEYLRDELEKLKRGKCA